jgi:hypothetical protein
VAEQELILQVGLILEVVQEAKVLNKAQDNLEVLVLL